MSNLLSAVAITVELLLFRVDFAVLGFIGALLAIPATLFVKTLFQGHQETRFLVVLLSGKADSQ